MRDGALVAVLVSMKTWVSFAVASVFVSRMASAAIAVFPVDATNLNEGEQDAIGQMVASAYQTEAREAVIPPKMTVAPLQETGGYKEAAQKLQASEYVMVSAVRLRQRIVITATRYTPDGTMVHSVKMTATSLDDLEPVSDRLAKALFTRTTPRETRSLDNVSATEGKRPNRVFVEKVMGLKASFIYPVGYGDDIAPMMSFGFDGRLEGRSYFLEIGAGFIVPSDPDGDKLSYGGLYTDIGASFYLMDASISPYLGGGVLPRLVGGDVTNFAVYGQTGLMFFRESSSRLYTDFRVAQNLLPVGFSGEWVDGPAGGFQAEDRKLYPTELTFSVGIGW